MINAIIGEAFNPHSYQLPIRQAGHSDHTTDVGKSAPTATLYDNTAAGLTETENATAVVYSEAAIRAVHADNTAVTAVMDTSDSIDFPTINGATDSAMTTMLPGMQFDALA